MIYSSFRANDDLKKYPEAVRTALEYLKSKDFTKMEVGTYPIQGKDIYALVQEITTCPIGQRRQKCTSNIWISSIFAQEKKHMVLHRMWARIP